MGGCLPFASHKAFKGALVLGALMGIVDLFLPHFQIGAVIQLSGSSDVEYSSSSTSNACSADFDQAACDAAQVGSASDFCNATYEGSWLADGACDPSCDFAECENDCGDCTERRSLLDTPSESSADRVFAFDTGAEDFGFLDMVKAFRTEAQKHFAKVAAKHDRAVQRGRSLQNGDTLRGGIKLSLGPVISSCNMFLEKNGEEVSIEDAEFADDIAEMEATCTQLASSVGTYMMAFVPWAAIATGFSVFCFFKSEKKKCACNCDNFTCCPINGLVWAIIHVCALLFLQNLLAGTLKQMNGSESMSEDEEVDSDFRTYARWGFGFTFSIITNFFCIFCCLVLACMVKEKDGEGTNVDTSPVAAGAVPAEAVPVQAVAV